MSNKFPRTLYNLLKHGQNKTANIRHILKYYPIIPSKLTDTNDSFIYKTCEIFNSLPKSMLELNKDKFNKQLDLYAINNFSNTKLHKTSGYITI